MFGEENDDDDVAGGGASRKECERKEEEEQEEEKKKARRPTLVMIEEGAINLEILLPTREKEECRESIINPFRYLFIMRRGWTAAEVRDKHHSRHPHTAESLFDYSLLCIYLLCLLLLIIHNFIILGSKYFPKI